MSLPLLDEITPFFVNQDTHVVKNLLLTAEGIFCAKSTNLNKVKDELAHLLDNADTTKPASNYMRLIRFFKLDDETKAELSKSLLCISFFVLGLKGRKPKLLTLDGTSWEFGAKKIHLITLAIVVNGVSIPICWEELDKKGISNYEERKALLDQACKWYDLSGMTLLADREYIGEEWFKYLTDNKIAFVIRLKKGGCKAYVDNQRTSEDHRFIHQKWRYRALEHLAHSRRYKNTGVCKQIKIAANTYTFVVFKNPKTVAAEPLLYFLSSLKQKKKIVQIYPMRWTIECCFKHLKSNGFNLEELNFEKSKKIKLMMSIVVFLYTLCIYQGLLAYKKTKKSDYKTYKNGTKTLAVSVFRKGKSLLTAKLNRLHTFLEFLTNAIRGKIKPKWVHV